MSQTQPLSRTIELTGDTFARVFPFYFAWDDEMRLVNFGPSLQKICHDVKRGVAVGDLFESLRAENAFSSIKELRTHESDLFLLQHRATKTRFRGQLLQLPTPNVSVMLCSPWLQSANEIEMLGITFNDFALHDASLDLLQILQTQQMANSDLQKLADRLTLQRTKLREQEAESRKLALVAARTDNAVVVTDAAGCIEWVNNGFVRTTGYTLEEVKGRKPGSVLQGAESDPVVIAYMREHIRSGKGFRTELVNYHKNGRRYWVSVEVQPIHDAGGTVVNFMAVERDITQQKSDEQRRSLQFNVSRILNEANTVRQASARIIQDVCQRLGWITGAVWMVDDARERLELMDLWHDPTVNIGAFVDISCAMSFERGVGLPGRAWSTRQSHWVPDVCSDINFPRAQAASSVNLHGALAFPIVNQGRVLGVFEFFSQRIEAPDDALLQVMNGIGHQVGQFIVRKKAEAEVQESHSLQRAIFASANYSIIAADPQGVITIFNQTAERWLGYRADEMIGKNTPAIIHVPEEVQRRSAELTVELGRPVEAGFETFVTKPRMGTLDEGEWTYVRKDGSTFPVLLSVTALFNSAGEITGYVGVASDITERKRAASELLAAKEEAESANRAKSDFLATMSHEIRTPMNGIIGMSSLLMETKLDASQREMTEAIHTSGEALVTIIDDILDFSKIEARRLDLVDEVFSVDSVIDGVVDLLSHKVQGKGLEMSVLIDPDVPMSLTGDPGRLRQILLNLVGNAIKFTDEGSVNLFVRRVMNDSGAQCLEFAVQDSGIGMTEEQQSQLFQAFTQVDGSSSRRYGGTGLGLVICKRLVEMMNGDIVVESRRHEGSTFRFRLPLRLAPVNDATPVWPQTARSFRVMIADPVELSARSTQLALEGLEHKPVVMEREAAVASALLDPKLLWDVLIIERRLFGHRTMEALKQLARENRKPRVILVGQLTDSVRERSSLSGVDIFLTKPPRRMQLRQALNEFASPELLATAETAPSTTPEHRGSSPRLLIVEDNEVNSRLATLLLEKLGFTSELARDGVEALEHFESGAYDGILMDCHMPRMDGYEATQRIRERERSADWNRPPVCIIAMTANAMAGERERCLAAGMDDYLSKPLRSEALMAALAQVSVLDDPSEQTDELWSAEDQRHAMQSIHQLADELSPEAAAQLLAQWLDDTPARLEELMQLAGGGDQSSLRRAAHSLKGSSALFGLQAIHQASRELEQLAEHETLQGQTPAATRLMSLFEAAEPPLRAELERLRALG